MQEKLVKHLEVIFDKEKPICCHLGCSKLIPKGNRFSGFCTLENGNRRALFSSKEDSYLRHETCFAIFGRDAKLD